MLKCEVTGNPCGTDTWRLGACCPCHSCAAWIKIERLTAENERLRGRNAALVESLRAHRCLVDNRATVGECQQCGCIDGLLISGDNQQLSVREQAMQELADQAQELKMGYEQPVNSEEGK